MYILKFKRKTNKETNKGRISQRGLFLQLRQIDHDKLSHFAYKLLPVRRFPLLLTKLPLELVHSTRGRWNILIFFLWSKTYGISAFNFDKM